MENNAPKRQHKEETSYEEMRKNVSYSLRHLYFNHPIYASLKDLTVNHSNQFENRSGAKRRAESAPFWQKSAPICQLYRLFYVNLHL